MKGGQGAEIQMIELSKLVPHPKNANVMAKTAMAKLKRHIARTGRYEPLVVRRHPRQEGKFEMINGHHRKRVLEELGHTEAACLVWELSDSEALLLLATVNRLSGKDAGGRRAELLEALAGEMGDTAEDGCAIICHELAALLPEEEGALRKLLADPGPVMAEPAAIAEMPEAFTVFLSCGEKRRLVAALRRTDRDLGRALMMWTDRFDTVTG
jgi:ParB-like chromosome segregation protein Spo0J